MLERDIEKHLVKRCKQHEILCEKFVSPQKRYVPDRILTFRGMAIFVELKAPGKRPNAGQLRDHASRCHNATVLWTDSIEGVNTIVESLVRRTPIPYVEDFKVQIVNYGD